MIKFALHIILLLTWVNVTYACDCANRLQIDSAVKNSAIIFSGELISETKVTVLMQDTAWAILDSGFTNEPFVADYIKFTFIVDKKFKGVLKKSKIDVYSPAGSTACGYQFLKEQVYIIYGDSIVLSRPDGKKIYGMRTTTCDRTGKFNKQEERDICKTLKRG